MDAKTTETLFYPGDCRYGARSSDRTIPFSASRLQCVRFKTNSLRSASRRAGTVAATLEGTNGKFLEFRITRWPASFLYGGMTVACPNPCRRRSCTFVRTHLRDLAVCRL